MVGLDLRYEYVIRAAHQVKRLGVLAAHADNYRALERNYEQLIKNKDSTKSDILFFQYAFICGEIATNFQNALVAFEKNIGKELDEQDKEKMHEIEGLLTYAKKKNLDQALNDFESLLRQHGRIV